MVPLSNSCGQWQYNIYLKIIAFTDKARIPDMAWALLLLLTRILNAPWLLSVVSRYSLQFSFTKAFNSEKNSSIGLGGTAVSLPHRRKTEGSFWNDGMVALSICNDYRISGWILQKVLECRRVCGPFVYISVATGQALTMYNK